MDSTVLIGIATFILGIIASIIIARYYHGLAIRKRLSVKVLNASMVFEGIESDVRKTLDIRYGSHPVSNLFQLDLSITNVGDRPIRDCIDPLTLRLPEDVELLEVFITSVDPVGRLVELKPSKIEDRTAIQFIFPLLNKGDSFVARLLSDGRINPDDLYLEITAEDLPPRIAVDVRPSRSSKDLTATDFLITGFIGLFLALPSIPSAIIFTQMINDMSSAAIVATYLPLEGARLLFTILAVLLSLTGLIGLSLILLPLHQLALFAIKKFEKPTFKAT